MKLDKFAVIMAVLLMAILAIGAVSAESIDSDTSIAADGGDSSLQISDDSAKDLSAADTINEEIVSADNDANDIGSAVLSDDDDPDEGTVYQITNDSYSTYFNEDGTPTAAISADGNYALQIGTVEGKNFKILSGKNILITGYYTEEWDEDEEDYITVGGDLFDSTISIGADVESVSIKGLTFHNTDKSAISIDSSKDVTLYDNVIFMTVDSNGAYSAAIYLNGAVSDLTIDDNSIFIAASASAYGINLMAYGVETNPSDIEITNNRIEMNAEDDFQSGIMEAIYLSDPANVLVDNNIIDVNAINDVFAYGIQIADDVQYVYYESGYTGNITSPRNIEIKRNEFDISSEYMTYAISVLSYGIDGYDPDYAEDDISFPTFNAFDTGISIVDNTVTAESTRGVMGIAGQTYNMTVNNNNVTVVGGSAEGIETSDALGNGTYALCVEYYCIDLDCDYKVTVRDNSVITNVTAEYLDKEQFSDLVIFENNTLPNEFIIDESTYSIFFYENGTSKGILPAEGNYALRLGYLDTRVIRIASGKNITITGVPNYDEDADETVYESDLVNFSIIIGSEEGDVEGIIIDGLDFDNSNANAIEILDLSKDIAIKHCDIDLWSEASEENPYFSIYGVNANGWIEGLNIIGNDITVFGNAPYNYGIQLGSWGVESSPKDIVISDNEIYIEADGLGEAIVLDNVVNAIVENNDIEVIVEGNNFAYGIQISDSAFDTIYWDDSYDGELTSPHDVLIKGNTVKLDSPYMIYGITALSQGVELDEDGDMEHFAFPLNITISENTVIAKSERGVMGIAGQLYNMTVISNDLTVIGGSAEGISSADALKNGSYALGVQYNNPNGEFYVVVKDNKVVTNVTAEFLNSEKYRPYVTFENNTASTVFLINDATYEDYFNEDGTAKDTLPAMGDYVLLIEELTGKDIKIESGSNINITGVKGSGTIQDGTITIGDNYGSAGSIVISGIHFVNINKKAIDLLDYENDITITGNDIQIYGDASKEGAPFSLEAIKLNGYQSAIVISDNNITVAADLSYLYGIGSSAWNAESNPEDIIISGNHITIDSLAESGMAEGIYLDTPVTVLIEDNEVSVDTIGNVFAYGIQVADSLYSEIAYGYEGSQTSPYNIEIKGNKVKADSEYMIYGITVLSSGIELDDEGDMELCAFDLNITISDNIVEAESDKGVIGIAGKVYNMTVINNVVTATGTSAEDVVSADDIGVGTYAIGVVYNGANAEDVYQVVVKDNTIITDVTPEYLSSEAYKDNVTFENNKVIPLVDGKYVINDDTYDFFFNEDGTLLEDSPLYDEHEVLLGNLSNKKLIIDTYLTIKAVEDTKLVNTTISLIDGADGSSIEGVTFEFDNNNVSTGIIYVANVENVLITGNNITAPDCHAMMMAIEIESGSEGCSGIVINDNIISVAGDTNYLYGIDVFQTWGSEAVNYDITIADNNVSIYGALRMAEPIYVSGSEEVEISGNNLTSYSVGCAYGIGTDNLKNAEISENTLDVISFPNGMAYAITSTNSEEIEILNNNITAEGKGVIGIGLNEDDGVMIDGNTINVTGGNFEEAETRDSLGKANAAILNKDDSSTDVIIGDNDITENFPEIPKVLIDESNYDQYFDEEGNLIEDAIPEGANVVLGDLTGKNMVFDIPLNITGAEGAKLVNSTITLVEGADGTTVDGLTIEFEGNSANGIIYAVDVSDITISNNEITVTDCTSTMMPIEVSASAKECSDIEIMSNTIDVTGTSNYIYGIDAFASYWDGFYFNNLNVSDNEITINGGAKMAEAIYVSGAKDVLIENNEIETTSPAIAYAIATDNSIGVEIYNNTMEANATSGSMAYALTSAFDNDVSIKDNVIIAEGQGAVGIGFRKDSDVAIAGNAITTYGDDFTKAATTNRLGQANAAILNKDGITDVSIGENTINEIGPKLIDDTTYSQFFDETGKLREDCTIAIGDTLLIGDLTNKDLIIDIPVDIKGIEGKKQVNIAVSLIDGADGSTIKDLNMEFTGDEDSGSFAVISAFEVSDIVIANNTIDIPDSTGYGYAMAIEVEGLVDGCDNVTISGNTIDFKGNTSGMYGIDVFTDYYAPNAQNTNFVITDNVVNIEGATSMAEPLYLNKINGLLVANNTLSSKGGAGADAYGIGASSTNDAVFADNNINANGTKMTYGISSTYSNNVSFENNNISAEGTGAVGLGLAGDSDVKVDNNEIAIVGGDFTTVSTWDSVGTANAAILDKDGTNTNVNVGENTLTENGKATDRVMTGNGTKDLQNILDAAEPGATVDLTGQYFNNVGTVTIDKDVAITGGKIIGAEGKPIFEIAPKSENGPNEVNITGVDFVVNNANTVVKVTGENATDGTSIEVPAINIKDNTIEAANDDVVTESVTLLELDSERPVLSPTNDISISGNTIAAGVDPFDFKVTSINSGGDTIIVPQNITADRKATVIVFENMNTTAVSPADGGKTGEYFVWRLTDADGKPLANTPMEIGFNGVVYTYEKDGIITDDDGYAKLQINLGYKGVYTFAICFLGNDQYNASFVVAKITVDTQKGTLTVPNKSYAATAKTKTLTATFKSAKGNPIADKWVTFTVNGKTYKAKTNAKGVASVNVSLNKKGTYNFVAKFAGDSTYTAINKTAKLTIK